VFEYARSVPGENSSGRDAAKRSVSMGRVAAGRSARRSQSS